MDSQTEKKITETPEFQEIDSNDFLRGIDFENDEGDPDEADPDDDATPDSSDEIEAILNASNPIKEGAKAIRKMGAEAKARQSDTEPEQKPEPAKSKLKPKAMATFYVATVDLALDKICGFIAKKPSGKEFRLTAEERADYLDISTAFFEAANIQFSPTIVAQDAKLNIYAIKIEVDEYDGQTFSEFLKED